MFEVERALASDLAIEATEAGDRERIAEMRAGGLRVRWLASFAGVVAVARAHMRRHAVEVTAEGDGRSARAAHAQHGALVATLERDRGVQATRVVFDLVLGHDRNRAAEQEQLVELIGGAHALVAVVALACSSLNRP